MNRVLVLDALQRSALAVTRSLGAKSIDVFTADESIHRSGWQLQIQHTVFHLSFSQAESRAIHRDAKRYRQTTGYRHSDADDRANDTAIAAASGCIS